MAQFDIYTSRGKDVELLMDLQDNMLANLSTLVAAPLIPSDLMGPPMRTVNPVIIVKGKEYILLTLPKLATPATQM